MRCGWFMALLRSHSNDSATWCGFRDFMSIDIDIFVRWLTVLILISKSAFGNEGVAADDLKCDWDLTEERKQGVWDSVDFD